jgi:hypothetical protein
MLIKVEVDFAVDFLIVPGQYLAGLYPLFEGV